VHTWNFAAVGFKSVALQERTGSDLWDYRTAEAGSSQDQDPIRD